MEFFGVFIYRRRPSVGRDNVYTRLRGVRGETHTKEWTDGQTDADGAVLLSISPHLSHRCRAVLLSYRIISQHSSLVRSPNAKLSLCVLCAQQSLRRREQVRWPDGTDLTTWTTALRVLAMLPPCL